MTQRVLIAIISCHARTAYVQAQRETWILRIPAGVDYKVFLGPSERTPLPDEVFVQCDDSYGGLPSKVKAVMGWAYDHGYDFVAKVDDDVILSFPEWLNSGFQNHDFTGHTNDDRIKFLIPWGFCYILSRKAMAFIKDHSLPANNNDEAWVSSVLAWNGIFLHHESRYHLHRGKRSDFIVGTKRALRAPPRSIPMDVLTPANGIAYAVFLHWHGYHATPDEVNIQEFHKLFKEIQ